MINIPEGSDDLYCLQHWSFKNDVISIIVAVDELYTIAAGAFFNWSKT